MTKITGIKTFDLRFPTSDHLDVSDAMNPDPDYSAAYLVIETTGAGDAFNGGFAVALSEGKTALESVKFGCATASISVTRPGTAPSMPARDEVEKVLII